MSIRIMHLADLHLGAPLSYLGDKAEQRRKEMENALLRALALAPEKNVHAVLIAGDLFDSFCPPPDLLARVKGAFEKTARNGIAIILVPGTHDSHRYTRCVYNNEAFPGVNILCDVGAPARKELNGESVHFYGFFGARKQDCPLFRRNDDEGIHIALVHGTVSKAAHWSADARDFPLQESEIGASGFQYVALGHYHNFREFKCGDVPAVYPGTLEGLKFGENGERYLVIAEIDRNGASIESMRHNQRTISEASIDLALAGIWSNDELLAAVENQVAPDTITKVCITGSASFLLELQGIATRLADRFFYLQITDETSVCGSAMIRALKDENTVRGFFVRKMLERIDRSSAEDKGALELALRLGIEQFMRVRNENQQALD